MPKDKYNRKNVAKNHCFLKINFLKMLDFSQMIPSLHPSGMCGVHIDMYKSLSAPHRYDEEYHITWKILINLIGYCTVHVQPTVVQHRYHKDYRRLQDH
jgi:hypothetical protein